MYTASTQENQNLSQNIPGFFPEYNVIEPSHYNEWVSSTVDDSIIRLNIKSLEGNTPYEYLLYSDKISRRNDGRLRDGDLRRYQHTSDGGWWCNGVDPLDNYGSMLWGCFKPNFPRPDSDKINKFIKYEHPYKEPTRAFFLYVSDAAWDEISARYDIAVTESDKQDARGFWYWVWKNNVPLIITEGAKKAAALLSAGYAAIAIPGVSSGFRNPKDENKVALGQPYLIPDLQHFCTHRRKVYICFDRDEKPETIKKVRKCIYKTGYLLKKAGCNVKIIDLPPNSEKGVDDFIAARGREAFDEIYQIAQSFNIWKLKRNNLLTYEPDRTINRRFIGEVSVPEHNKLIVIKAAKGTGKTEWLATQVSLAHARGQRVLVLTHRVQLGEALCNRFGIDYVTEIKTSPTGGVLGYGLCVDSLHQKSGARFNPDDWSNAVVIIDEVDQVFWHLLNSSTEVKKHRVTILRNLKELIHNVLGSQFGKIYLSSADVSDIDVKYVLSLINFYVKPYVIVNKYQPSSGDCYVYDSTPTPKSLIKALIENINNGGVPFICCSAQKTKSKWSTKTLEKLLLKRFPSLKILRIDSESVSDPNHPAYNCISNLNQILPKYDVVLVTSCLETGVSIDIENHFTDVWGIASGVQAENSVRQILKRVRSSIPRHIWIARYGLNKCRVGNGSTSMASLLLSQQSAAKANIHLLTAADHQDDDDDFDYDFDAIDIREQPQSLKTWAKKACIINAQMSCYRETILEGLKAEGYNLIMVSPEGENAEKDIAQDIKQMRNDLYSQECSSISNSPVYTEEEYCKSKDKRAKTQEERYREKKTELTKRYGVDITPEMVEKDDDGWYPQLRMHYYLTLGRSQVAQHDAHRAKKMASEGSGAVWQPDFNRGQLLGSVEMLETLGLLTIMEPGKQWKKIDPEILHVEHLAKKNRHIIKNYLGINISEKDSPIAVVQKLLAKLGCKLHYVARLGSRGNRHMIYEFIPPTDGRDEIFQAWLERSEVKVKVTSSKATSLKLAC